MKTFHLLIAAVCLLAVVRVWAVEPDLEAVKMRFDDYVLLSAKFDVAVADFYSDDAVVKTDRHYPDGSVKKLQMPGKAWKTLLRQLMSAAKERGDLNTYAEVKVEAVEGGRIQVRAQRTSKLKGNISPISWHFAKSADGTWLIVEEQSVTRQQ